MSRSYLRIDAIEMHPHECLARIGTPVSEQPILEVLGAQRLLEQRIVAQVDHSGAEIVAGAPVSVDLAKFLGGQWRIGGYQLLRHHCCGVLD